MIQTGETIIREAESSDDNEDRLDFIFKMYQRINQDAEGQGIGLYLIKKIIDASGGKIEVDSIVGTGSTFRIFFTIH